MTLSIGCNICRWLTVGETPELNRMIEQEITIKMFVLEIISFLRHDFHK